MNEQRLRNWRVLPTLSISEVCTVTGLKRGQVVGLLKRGELEQSPVPKHPQMVTTRSVIALVEPQATTGPVRVSARMARDLEEVRRRVSTS